MNSAVVAVIAIAFFIWGYRFYARYLATKVFRIDENEGDATPAHQFKDGVDFVPALKHVLFGHHFSSIAGAAPIVGPAVAVIWGWVPAILWIIIGVIFMGASHDFGTLVISMKHKGKSMGQLAEDILGPRVRTIFLMVIFFLVWIVLAVFALIIANLFMKFPASVLPVNFEIIIALLMGYFLNRKNKSLTIASIFAQLGLLLMIYLGTKYPIGLEFLFGENIVMGWIIFLMIYSFIASVLPVWSLLQPRDYINSHQLSIGLVLLVLGLIITHPPIVAPAFNANPEGAPSWFPFLFITIACGAISGFHGLVSSGTTSKQVNKWSDAKPIGYGSMLGEGLLAILATLAVTAGFSSSEEWFQHYHSWGAANGLSAKIGAFVLGSGKFISGLGIPENYSHTIIAVLIISFAATSLDTATRIQRYIVAEIGESLKIPILKNRFVGSFVAVASAFALLMLKSGGKGGLFLWPLFGATNQMLAGLSLIVITVYLVKNKRPHLPYLLPAVFIILMTSVGLILNIKIYYQNADIFLMVLGVILFFCQLWIVVEGVRQIQRLKLEK